MRVLLGSLTEVPEGRVKVVFFPQGTPPKRSILFTRAPIGPKAYWNVCRHLPVPLDGGLMRLEEGLVCLTHGAKYQPNSGRCLEGPCVGEYLEAIPIEIEGDQVYALVP